MATRLQKKVYEKTREIPVGYVSTYKEIAKAIGRPGAFRAVGNALNKNPDPLNVPCHRVVRADLKVGGYAKGSSRKEEILKREGVQIVDGLVVGGIFRF